jgi:hypothetical protein
VSLKHFTLAGQPYNAGAITLNSVLSYGWIKKGQEKSLPTNILLNCETRFERTHED